MIGVLAIKSIIDVGCGKGVSTSYFMDRGAQVLCVEGSHDAVMQSLLPPDKIVEHDFSRGPWWPSMTYDAVWCVEFVEHVERQFMNNYLPIFHKAALIFVTSSSWNGWHHVEIHPKEWWRIRMEAQGFVYSEILSSQTAKAADIEFNSQDYITRKEKGLGQYLRLGMFVFINPKVASLSNHHHLMGGYGCYGGVANNWDGGLPCEKDEHVMPSDYLSLLDCKLDQKSPAKENQLWQCKRNPKATIPKGYSIEEN